MSEAPVNESAEMHTALKTALAELLPDMLREHQSAPVAQVPAPPVAPTLRPSTWHPSQQAPDPAGNVAPAAAPAAGSAVEQVRLKDDRDLDAFVRSLARRLEHPAERAAIAAGHIRFTMTGHGTSAAAPAHATSGTERIERGAVTERIIERAAAHGGVLVLGPKAVLTPMGKDRARALGVQIQREAAC